MNKERFYQLIEICMKQNDVREAVLENHDNNRWWPDDVRDRRKRLIIGGLSSRISYNMIHTYQEVIRRLDHYSYEEIRCLEDKEIAELIKPLGLTDTRIKFIKSMIAFMERDGEELYEYSNEELIDKIAENVYGASFKVGECCALYFKGYHCGIMPVDSGMKEKELPCVGFEYIRCSRGNKILSMQLRKLTEENDFSKLVLENGYGDLNIPDIQHPTWLIHLVLIYFKRFYCNKGNPEKCPLYQKKMAEGICK